MEIYICTYGRPLRQVTFNNLPPRIQNLTQLVVQDREAGLYKGYDTIVLPPHIQTIGATRQWLLESRLASKMVMLDDDLTFAHRREDEPTKFEGASQRSIEEMFEEVEKCLDEYIHVGVSHREGANYKVDSHIYASRMMRILAYDVDKFLQTGARFDRVPVMEDFDVTLQLLRQGHINCIVNDWVHNQSGSNSQGGCSTYRTDQVQEDAAKKLAELHPNYVTVVQKTTKTAWGGKERYDVRVQWKKAYRESRNVGLLDQREGDNTAQEGVG
jgi:hypothetical protein